MGITSMVNLPLVNALPAVFNVNITLGPFDGGSGQYINNVMTFTSPGAQYQVHEDRYQSGILSGTSAASTTGGVFINLVDGLTPSTTYDFHVRSQVPGGGSKGPATVYTITPP